MIIKTSKQVDEYKQATELSMIILNKLHASVAAGVTPMDIEELSLSLIKSHGALPAFVGVGPIGNKYKYVMCISVNDTVVHGIPNKIKFVQGDIVKLDFGLIYNGYYTDHCVTVGINNVAKKDKRLIAAGKQIVLSAVAQATTGKTIGDIGFVMENTAKEYGYKTVKEFTGHGIGRSLHDDPMIPTYGRTNTGRQLEDGMVLCIEAQVVEGSNSVHEETDGWTYKTDDGGNVVMFEYMVIVKKDEPFILTDTRKWESLV